MGLFDRFRHRAPSFSKEVADASNTINSQAIGMYQILNQIINPFNHSQEIFIEIVSMYFGIHWADLSNLFNSREIYADDERQEVLNYFCGKSQFSENIKKDILSQINFYKTVGDLDDIIHNCLDRIRYINRNGYNPPFGKESPEIALNLDIFGGGMSEMVLYQHFSPSVKKGLEMLK